MSGITLYKFFVITLIPVAFSAAMNGVTISVLIESLWSNITGPSVEISVMYSSISGKKTICPQRSSNEKHAGKTLEYE